MYKNLLLPAGILSATIIGGGMFALPYVASRAGLLTSFFYLAAFGAVFCVTHLMYADIIIRTKEKHRFAGYANIYLGKTAKWIAVLSTIIGMIFTLTAELILSASFLNLLFPDLPQYFQILFIWALGSLAIFFEINRLAISELLISAGIIFIVGILLIYGLPDLFLSAQVLTFNLGLSAFLLPYGAILFALDGRPAIPATVGYFRNNGLGEEKSKRAILLGTIIPAIIYSLFILAILAISKNPSPDSITALIGAIPSWLLFLLGVLGAISLFSTYIVIGRDIKKGLEYDFKFPQVLAGTVVVALPLALYFFGFREFLELVALVGGIFISIEGILILLMWRRASKYNTTPGSLISNLSPIIIYLLLLVFAGGIVYEIIKQR